jgi:transposase
MEEQKAKQKRDAPSYFSESFKREIIEEYLKSGEAKYRIQARYGIKGKSAIHVWMQQLGYSDITGKGVNLEPINQWDLAKKSTPKSSHTLELEAKIRLLERQLDDERLRSELYNRMIDLAEKTYKIPVRKNFNTK